VKLAFIRCICKFIEFEVILDSEIYKGLKYNKATPIFHQWRDISRQVFGLKFESSEDAEGFSNAVLSVLDSSVSSEYLEYVMHSN
jgi:WH1 domain